MEQTLGQRPRAVAALPGATSSDLYRLDMGDRALVLRRFRPERWPEQPEALSSRELSILRALEPTGLPAPLPVGQPPANGVIMSFLPGNPLLPESPDPAWLDSLACSLARIHALSVSVAYRYESWNSVRGGNPPVWWRSALAWDEAQRLVAERPSCKPVFLHRDYHPANLLWQ